MSPAGPGVADLLIVGTGLIGTSIGLALAGTREVLLHDLDPIHLGEAVDRGAGRAWDGAERVSHAVLAVPPSLIPTALLELQQAGIAATYSHVASVQARVQADLVAAGCDLTTVCGGHPMAGAELPGPGLAAATLFAGRPWLLCPGESTSVAALAAATELAVACGGQVTRQEAAEHDRIVALVSHLPQIAASALAGLLRGQQPAVALSGPGLRDTTRIAASDPRLWQDVLLRNAPSLAPLVRQLAEQLGVVADALTQVSSSTAWDRADGGAPDPVLAEVTAVLAGVLEAGRTGRALVPVKRGGTDRDFAGVDVAVPDEPGQLAALLSAAAAAGVNVEDVNVDHLPGRPTGVISLVVRRPEQARLHTSLLGLGWAARLR